MPESVGFAGDKRVGDSVENTAYCGYETYRRKSEEKSLWDICRLTVSYLVGRRLEEEYEPV